MSLYEFGNNFGYRNNFRYTTFNLRNMFKANALSKICKHNFRVFKTWSFKKINLTFSIFLQAPRTFLVVNTNAFLTSYGTFFKLNVVDCSFFFNNNNFFKKIFLQQHENIIKSNNKKNIQMLKKKQIERKPVPPSLPKKKKRTPTTP